MPFDQPERQLEIAKKNLSGLSAGVTHFPFYPSVDTLELRAIILDWPNRVANYFTFMDQELKKFIREQGIQVIGYCTLRDLMRLYY